MKPLLSSCIPDRELDGLQINTQQTSNDTILLKNNKQKENTAALSGSVIRLSK
jgi:hypothetical protein